MNQILGNILQVCPFTGSRGKNLLIYLDIAVFIHVVHSGVFVHFRIVDFHTCHRQNILLQVIAQDTHKDKAADNTYQQRRNKGAAYYLQDRKGDFPRPLHGINTPWELPILSWQFFLVSVHFITSIVPAKQPSWSFVFTWHSMGVYYGS